MYMETFASGGQIACTSNATDASFPSRVATKTRPSGSGVIDLSSNGNITCNALRVQFFGTDADGETFKCRILGWNKIPATSSTQALYVPCPLSQVTCTLSSATGVNGTAIIATDTFFVDTIVIETGYNDDVDVSITSPTGNIPAHLIVDTKGCELVEFIFDMNSSGASANALVGRL